MLGDREAEAEGLAASPHNTPTTFHRAITLIPIPKVLELQHGEECHDHARNSPSHLPLHLHSHPGTPSPCLCPVESHNFSNEQRSSCALFLLVQLFSPMVLLKHKEQINYVH